ncbi:helix-turn-helix domain-containing protein [Streptomyces sp. NBC_00893]|uniref:winged helix-turn-helix domain-containing protein n=1 Tax=Streptomyces sp. NBC_00893 TaxID=2975862 RepID=UPI002257FF84|nr:helix-turn-helix domain-containing protein [Streptomyces sp. NBC_00893]MCX4850498.1 helix-turn-helix domain-containing protein [Streptomyces sp. NBC_00893]
MELPEQPSQVQLTARNLRGVAHPLRVRMLTVLRTEGPATATTLARRLNENTGATSYHLRQLAEYGFIVEAPSRGGRRERWWQAVHVNTVVPDNSVLVDGDGLGIAYLQALGRVWSDAMTTAIDAANSLSPEWRDAQDFGDYVLTLTPAEAAELSAEIHQLLRRRNSAPEPTGSPLPEGAARVAFQFQLFPTSADRHVSHPTDSE